MLRPRESRMHGDEEATEALIEEKSVLTRSSLPVRYDLIVPWSLAAILFCSTLFFALRDSMTAHDELGNFERGFHTDFVSSSLQIPLRIIRKNFTSDLLYNATSQSLYNQVLDPNEPTYIGDAPGVDKAWHKLLHAQAISLEPEEVNQVPLSHLSAIWWNGRHNYMELSVFHYLHCLDQIRLALKNGGGYHTHVAGDWLHQGRAHLDHCVDQIRQALMCHSDLTPVPLKALEGGPAGVYIGNGETHTCRDFDGIWNWVEERGKKSKALGDYRR